jgi:23S rRNA pseudouridine1911/1915/1917 synthase
VALRSLTVDRGDAGQRLDLVVRRHLADLHVATRTRIQHWIEGGLVAVNGRATRRAAARAALGDVVTVWVPDSPPRRRPVAEDMGLRVLYEDEHLIAVDKPAGIVSHPTYRHPTGTVINGLLWYAHGWPGEQRPTLIGRLDKMTSGIVVAAKTAGVHAALQRSLGAAGHGTKDYLALVRGRARSAGTIALGLQRDPTDRRRVVASAVSGAPSVTRFERLAHSPGVALLRCRLLTGRMHQIRVHLAARGWPIVGDLKYGDTQGLATSAKPGDPRMGDFNRHALHAWRMAVRHPVTGAALRIEAPIPRELDDLMRRFGICLARCESSWLPSSR